MGPAGSGKTTVGILLAKQLSWEFADADDFHSPANKEKMSRGVGLSDEDRIPWLQTIRKAMERWLAERRSVVLGCSALKRSYREQPTDALIIDVSISPEEIVAEIRKQLCV